MNLFISYMANLSHSIFNYFKYSFPLSLLAMGLSACEKVSPTGILVGTTSVDDRVKMSLEVYKDTYESHLEFNDFEGEYSFIVGSDSHITTDTGRLDEMQADFIDHRDLFMAHLGDIADTKAEYYMNLANSLERGKEAFLKQRYYQIYGDGSNLYLSRPEISKLIAEGVIGDPSDLDNILPGDLRELLARYGMTMKMPDDIQYPFFTVVGNHDITHDGWALFSTIFHTSTFEFTVKVADGVYDRFIFLDSANGTLGKIQIDALEDGMLTPSDGITIRHTFTFTHTNIFRPASTEFASTYAREELYYILRKYADWNTTIAFYGHVHVLDDRVFAGVRHITMPAMSESNAPEPGPYLMRVTCHTDGTLSVDPVEMKYSPF